MPHQDRYFSEEAKNILGKSPNWIVRWGGTIVFLIYSSILMGCYFIKSPDVLKAPIVITTINPPADVIARYDGLIDTLYIRDGMMVQSGDIIAVLKSAADWSDIRKLSDGFNAISNMPINNLIEQSWLYDKYKLGELQPVFLDVQSSIRAYKDYIQTDYIGHKKHLISQQITKNKEYYECLQHQRELFMQDLSYGQRSIHRDSLLQEASVIAMADYETSLQSFISKKNNKVSFDATLVVTELQILQNEQQIIELDIQRQNEVSEYERKILDAIQQCVAHIAQWELQYVLRAPISGQVSLMEFWTESQYINIGDKLASIIPTQDTEVVGRLQISSSGFGKIGIGNNVNVQLNGYPYMEFGVLRGVIRSLSAVPEKINTSDGPQIVYLAEVSFPNGLHTSYDKQLPMIQQMDGLAEIITKDLRLIDRFFQPIRSLFNNQ